MVLVMTRVGLGAERYEFNQGVMVTTQFVTEILQHQCSTKLSCIVGLLTEVVKVCAVMVTIWCWSLVG
ncbi:hypothetical protein OH492_20480 [Vibrio chagasii]|nr:hypothetical protein [Vibrio chagasii]